MNLFWFAAVGMCGGCQLEFGERELAVWLAAAHILTRLLTMSLDNASLPSGLQLSRICRIALSVQHSAILSVQVLTMGLGDVGVGRVLARRRRNSFLCA